MTFAMLNALGSLLLVGIFFVVPALTQREPCTLKVFDESGEEVENVCAEQWTSSGCGPFVQSFNRSDLPDGFKMTEEHDSVSSPRSIDVASKLTYYSGSKTFYPGISVNWTTPTAKASRKDVTGYLLIWRTPEDTKCRLFKFNSSNSEWPGKKLHFQVEIAYLESSSYYDVLVYSMPPPESLDESKQESFFVSAKLTTGTTYIRSSSEPGLWYPSLSASVPTDGTIQVQVGSSPDQFNLTKFEVMLVKFGYDEHNYYKQQNIIAPLYPESPFSVVTFEDLERDQYKIVVKVHDTYPKEDGKCLCWVQETKGRHCIVCESVATQWFNVSAAEKNPTPTTKEPDNEGTDESETTTMESVIEPPKGATEKTLPTHNRSSSLDTGGIIAAVIGATLLVGLGVLAFIVLRRKQKDKDSCFDVARYPWSRKRKPGPRGQLAEQKVKTVLIVWAMDPVNEAHTVFVEKLAKYLKTHCQCYVIFPPWESQGIQTSGSLLWLRTAINAADTIIFIDSAEAERLLITYNSHKAFIHDDSMNETNQLFQLALDHFFLIGDNTRHKLVMLHYREKCGCGPHLKDATRMQIPVQFPDLLRHIHGLTEEEALSYAHILPLSADHYENVEDGISAELCSALRRAVFHQSELSNDTGFGSSKETSSTGSSSIRDRDSIRQEDGDGYPADLAHIEMGISHLGESATDPDGTTHCDEESCYTVEVNPFCKTRQHKTDSKPLQSGLEKETSTGEDVMIIPPQPFKSECSFSNEVENFNDDSSTCY